MKNRVIDLLLRCKFECRTIRLSKIQIARILQIEIRDVESTLKKLESTNELDHSFGRCPISNETAALYFKK